MGKIVDMAGQVFGRLIVLLHDRATCRYELTLIEEIDMALPSNEAIGGPRVFCTGCDFNSDNLALAGMRCFTPGCHGVRYWSPVPLMPIPVSPDQTIPQKIEIVRRADDDCFNVRVGDRYDDRGMNREEVLGCVAEFLYLERTHFYLKTKESWDAVEARRAEIRERASLGNDGASSVALTDPATTLGPTLHYDVDSPHNKREIEE